MHSDAELVLQARSGDRQAFAAIYDRYADRVHDFCYSVLRDRDEAADAMQDTFVLAAQRMGQLEDPEKLRSWLFAVARHEAIRRGKARRRMAPTDGVGDHDASDDSGPEAVVSRGDAQEIVWAAAAGLSDRDRALLDLHLRQDLDGHELAEAIGVSPAHAYTLMNRMRDQVERSLGALLVARLGRDDCTELQRLLEPWDGSFTPLWRKRVAHHVDECDVCSDRRQVLASPLSLLAAAPLVPAPIALRSFTLDRMEDVATHGSGGNGHGTSNNGNGTHGWSDPSARGGFPPGVDDTSWTAPRRLARSALGVAAAALLTIFVFGATYLMFDDDKQASTVVAAQSVTTTRGPADPVTTVAPGSSLPATSKPPSRREEPVVATPEGDEASTGGGESTTTTTTTIPPDKDRPVVQVRMASAEVDEEAAACTTTSTIATADVTDASGIKSVVLSYDVGLGLTSKPMTAGAGSTYTGTVGPFPVGTVTEAKPFTVTVTAEDEAGNEGSASASMTLNPCNPIS